jgi:predicted house-cleaning noncanonical NTP pyrophosphatase (MazG superfamily)
MKPKLVRDRVPAIIRNSGRGVKFHYALGEAAKTAIVAKMHEEVAEFEETPTLEEAADIYAAFMKMLALHGHTYEGVVKKAIDKAYTRGGFENMIILDEVTDGK